MRKFDQKIRKKSARMNQHLYQSNRVILSVRASWGGRGVNIGVLPKFSPFQQSVPAAWRRQYFRKSILRSAGSMEITWVVIFTQEINREGDVLRLCLAILTAILPISLISIIAMILYNALWMTSPVFTMRRGRPGNAKALTTTGGPKTVQIPGKGHLAKKANVPETSSKLAMGLRSSKSYWRLVTDWNPPGTKSWKAISPALGRSFDLSARLSDSPKRDFPLFCFFFVCNGMVACKNPRGSSRLKKRARRHLGTSRHRICQGAWLLRIPGGTEGSSNPRAKEALKPKEVGKGTVYNHLNLESLNYNWYT